jgi:hypothetical protein
VSFLLVVAGIFSLMAMAALAIDLVTLYTAKSEAQKAADAAALAGAKMFVASGITSGETTGVCTAGGGGTTLSNVTAAAAAAANTIQGAAATVSNVVCTGTTENPQIAVTISRSNLPTFFGRIFGVRGTSVSATAKAEAFNNSGGGASVVSVGSVKPWLVPNCDPGVAPPGVGPCPSAGYFINTGAGYALNTPATYLGTVVQLRRNFSTTGRYWGIDFSASVPAIQASVCPQTTSGVCSDLTFGTPPYYVDNIACGTTNQSSQRLSCGSTVTPINVSNPPYPVATSEATQCLIHANGNNPGDGQDTITPQGAGNPPTIAPGFNNPNTALAGATNISRSDSIVTLPIFNYNGDPCGGGPCTPVQVIGFLQLGIQEVSPGGRLTGVIMNAVGCDPNNPGTPQISGGGLSPIPVRLVQ